MTRATSSFTILGAGLLGRLLAVTLTRQGHTVSIYDKGGPLGEHSAARVAGGMLAPLAESAVAEHGVVRMGRHALARWPELLAPLAMPVYFEQEGTLLVWHRQDAPQAAHMRQQLDATRAHIPELPAMEWLDAEGMARIEPALAPRFAQGMYLPGEGQLDNRQLLASLAQEMERLGVQVHWNTPRELAAFGSGHAGWLLDCRGLGARGEWPQLRGVRGEVIRIHAPEVTLQRPTRLLHPRYPAYIAPKENHVFVIGATEIESEDLSPVSVRSTLELLSAAYAVHPGFAEARILESSVQCRPALPDNLPAIRQVAPRTLQINGMYRHGYMIAPALHDVVLELLDQGASALGSRFDLAMELL
ncbi:MAG: glycine oxidase ThiO [Burkholderiales bacterium 68-12]|nr:MAG: glycine oxidase ThiO [Burkholderiales bacterium 68-12]